MLDAPFSPWPIYSDEEIEAVTRVLKSGRVNYWTGEECKLFEKEFAELCGVDYAIAVSNGTVALELALKALEISADDEVIVSPRTFIASASAIIAAGASPVFADVDIGSQNISLESIKAVYTKKTKAIICVHLAGWPCDMDPIMEWAKENNVWIIEDCAQAHGATYKGKNVGSLGHLGCWSFCQDKIISTGGEGGMVTTDDEHLYKKVWSLKDHGKHFENVKVSENRSRLVHQGTGTNARLTEMQATIGRVQLRKLSDWQKIRNANVEKIVNMLRMCPGLRIPLVPKYIRHAWYKLYLFIDLNFIKKDWSVGQIIAEINQLGVPCYHGICPEIYKEKALERFVSPGFYLPNAKLLGETSLMLLVHPTLTEDEVSKTSEIVEFVVKKACC